ncbi:membrane protein [Microvirga vignae]|uniref:Membrane protein n=1 Tax=Microvirga vignae TaxID=1225564 RepID=A0A0H1RFK4_9HYPH|nr:membrane protein [Microvirga vignae]
MSLFKRLIPDLTPVSRIEQLRVCAGVLIGILLLGLIGTRSRDLMEGLPLLSAPLGASAILLFALPGSPLAQPWSILGGNMISAAIGVACARWIPEELIAASMAGTLSVAMMFVLRCLHPPSGALALMAVLGGPTIKAAGFGFVVWPVGAGSLAMLVVALIFNNLTGKRYPHLSKSAPVNRHKTSDPTPMERVGVKATDLDIVLNQYDQVIDMDRDSLEDLFRRLEMQAYNRRFGGMTCAEIMSRDVATVTPETSLRDAWKLFRQHHIKALPVVSGDHRAIGIITQTDLIKHSDWDLRTGFQMSVPQIARRVIRLDRKVGEIMTSPVQTARQDAVVAELVPRMADAGLHQVPIVDRDSLLVGIVTQSDLVAALFRGRGMIQAESRPNGRIPLSAVR